MSHFTVLVIHEEHETLEYLLAPFDENVSVPRYKERASEENVQQAIKFFTENPTNLANDNLPLSILDDLTIAGKSVAATATLLGSYVRSDSRMAGHDKDGYFTWSTYNPQSKWDWYVVGGRWSNYFDLKPECVDDPRVQRGDQPAIGGFDPTVRGKCDSAPKGCIDLEGMRARAGEKARERYREIHELIDDTPPAVLWPEFLQRVDDTKAAALPYTIAQARLDYNAQPRVQKFNAAETSMFADLQDFQISEQTYVARAEAGAVPGFAVLYQGEWIEPGHMGWWGMSTDTASTRAGYLEHVNGLIDKLDDDMYLTSVDAHI